MRIPKVLGGRMASCSGGAGILPAVFLSSTLRENRRRDAGATKVIRADALGRSRRGCRVHRTDRGDGHRA
jgi:hypothetical protein